MDWNFSVGLVSVCELLTSFSIDKIALAVVSAHQNPLHVRLHVLQWISQTPHLPFSRKKQLALTQSFVLTSCITPC